MNQSHSAEKKKWRSTTVLSVRHRGTVVLGADGQVTYGNTIMKSDTKKLRRMLEGRVLVGFAGSTADAFALMERFEEKLKDHPANMPRAATELARDWRTDRMLRRLEAMMLVADADITLLLSGQGDVVQPTDGVVGIGSGGPYAAAAAKALVRHSDLSASDIVQESLRVAADIDIYTNANVILEELQCSS